MFYFYLSETNKKELVSWVKTTSKLLTKIIRLQVLINLFNKKLKRKSCLESRIYASTQIS